MTNKKTILSLVAIFTALLLVSFASATDCVKLASVSVPSSLLHNSLTFNVTNTDGLCSVDKTGINLSVTDTSGKTGTWTVTPSNISTLVYGTGQLVTATATFAAHQSGSITPLINMTGDSSEAETLSLSIPINSTASLDVTSVTDMSKTTNATIRVNNTGNVALSNINLSYTGDFNVSFSTNKVSTGTYKPRFSFFESFFQQKARPHENH